MKNQHIAFILKSDINTDGRVLNEIQILLNQFEHLHIHLILLPDKPVHIQLDPRVHIYPIHCKVRNSKFFKLFTVLEFTLKTWKILRNVKPTVIHAQDSAVVLPTLLYRFFHRKAKYIYDDHEIPNENRNWRSKINDFLESKLLKKAAIVISANEERMQFIIEQFNLKNTHHFFLNLPYFKENSSTESAINVQHIQQLKELDEAIAKGTHFIIHQGVLQEDRGQEKLAKFSKILPEEYKILLLGGNQQAFQSFVSTYRLNAHNFHFIGTVDYSILPRYWEKGMASIVMYLPTYINNKLCAPNRFYLSVDKQLPVIINRDNPVLSNFVSTYKCGFYIENFTPNNFAQLTAFDRSSLAATFDQLKQKQIANFTSIYSTILN